MKTKSINCNVIQRMYCSSSISNFRGTKTLVRFSECISMTLSFVIKYCKHNDISQWDMNKCKSFDCFRVSVRNTHKPPRITFCIETLAFEHTSMDLNVEIQFSFFIVGNNNRLFNERNSNSPFPVYVWMNLNCDETFVFLKNPFKEMYPEWKLAC